MSYRDEALIKLKGEQMIELYNTITAVMLYIPNHSILHMAVHIDDNVIITLVNGDVIHARTDRKTTNGLYISSEVVAKYINS